MMDGGLNLDLPPSLPSLSPSGSDSILRELSQARRFFTPPTIPRHFFFPSPSLAQQTIDLALLGNSQLNFLVCFGKFGGIMEG
ncbi:hypothetical protein L1987_43189 [Smallanthus sonchifolius]|uniref:Uncharacterized protein n=1 Tax=Smallanthus sonchifolius TaxID=185202 RepID=A0ACB9GL17_9ASTR|nr:hypothetical protein L1987_43189 [Smallanthus sonchifolius]